MTKGARSRSGGAGSGSGRDESNHGFAPGSDEALVARAANALLDQSDSTIVNLSDVKARTGLSQERFASAVRNVSHARTGLSAIPNEDQKRITPAHRAAAVRLGAKDAHQFAR